MQQSGVKEISLFSSVDTVLSFNSSGDIIGVAGTSILIENCNEPNNTFSSSKINTLFHNDYEITFQVEEANQEVIENIHINVFGFFPLISYYNSSKKLVYEPFRFVSAEQVIGGYLVTLKADRPTRHIFDVVELGSGKEQATMTYISFFKTSGLFNFIWVKIVDSTGVPIETITISDLSSSNGTLSVGLTHEGEGVYSFSVQGDIADTVITLDSADYEGDVTITFADKIFDTNFTWMRYFSALSAYIPFNSAVSFSTSNLQLTNPSDKWDIKVFSSSFQINNSASLYFQSGETYRLTVDVDSFSAKGKIIFTYDTITHDITTAGLNTFDFTGTTVLDFLLKFSYFSGSLSAVINGISIEKL